MSEFSITCSDFDEGSEIDGSDADSAILDYIKENRCIVATMDKELKNKIKQSGSSVLSIHNDKIVLEN